MYARLKKPGLAPKRLISTWTVNVMDTMNEIAAMDSESAEVLQTIRELL